MAFSLSGVCAPGEERAPKRVDWQRHGARQLSLVRCGKIGGCVKQFTSDGRDRCYEGLIALPIDILKTPQRSTRRWGFHVDHRNGQSARRAIGRVLSE